jgi:hypothetical protein
MTQEQFTFAGDSGSSVPPATTIREPQPMDLKQITKDLQRLVGGLRKIHTSKRPLTDEQRVTILHDAAAAAKGMALDALISWLEQETREAEGRLQVAIERRRESLLLAARNENVHHKRFGEYDRVELFKVSYRGKKVRLELGSEPVCEFEEADGERILERIQQESERLEKEPFSRDEFFRTMKDAIRMARARGLERDGWVSVRTLFAYVMLLRNLGFEDFVRRPGSRSFRDYSTAQFVYDLARFGRGGWSLGDEILRAMTPNMATVAAGKAMTLPDLDSLETLGPQFAVLRIENKGGTGGAERGPGQAR